WENRFFVNGKPGVGDYQINVQTNHIAITFAFWTSAIRIIETEQMRVWLQKLYAIQFEAVVEGMDFPGGNFFDFQFPISLKKSSLYRIRQTIKKIFIIFGHDSIYDKTNVFSFFSLKVGFVDAHYFLVKFYSTVALLK